MQLCASTSSIVTADLFLTYRSFSLSACPPCLTHLPLQHEIPAAAQAVLSQATSVTLPGQPLTFKLDIGDGRKAKSGANAGATKEMKDSRPADGAAITLLTALRVPSAATGLSIERNQADGVSATQTARMGIVFSGCSQPDHRTVSQFGLDCEDQLRIMSFPVIRAYAPHVPSNEVSVKILNVDLFTPQCALPFRCTKGKKLRDAPAGKDAKAVTSPRSSRTLLYTSLASHDGNEHRDSLVRSLIEGRELRAVEQSSRQREARTFFPLPFGRTVLAGAEPLDGKPLIIRNGRGLGASPAWSPEASAPGPYARVYRQLWTPPQLDNAPLSNASAGGSVGLRALASAHTTPPIAPAPAARRLGFDLGDLAPQGAQEGCLAGSVTLMAKSQKIWSKRGMIVVYVAVINWEVALYSDFRVDLGGALCIDRRRFALSVIPMFRIRATMTAGINLAIVEAGIGIEAYLMVRGVFPKVSGPSWLNTVWQHAVYRAAFRIPPFTPRLDSCFSPRPAGHCARADNHVRSGLWWRPALYARDAHSDVPFWLSLLRVR